MPNRRLGNLARERFGVRWRIVPEAAQRAMISSAVEVSRNPATQFERLAALLDDWVREND